MAEVTALENGRISNFEGLVTLDRVILHTVCASFIDVYPHAKFHRNRKKLIVDGGRTDERTYGCTFETSFIRSTLSKSQPKKQRRNG